MKFTLQCIDCKSDFIFQLRSRGILQELRRAHLHRVRGEAARVVNTAPITTIGGDTISKHSSTNKRKKPEARAPQRTPSLWAVTRAASFWESTPGVNCARAVRDYLLWRPNSSRALIKDIGRTADRT